MPLSRKPWLLDILAAIAGVILALAYAPFNLHPCAVFALALLLWTLLPATPKRAFWRGWLFFIIAECSSLWWIYLGIHTFFPQLPIPVSVGLCLLVFAYWACFVGLATYGLQTFFTGKHALKLTFIFALLIVWLEMLRSLLGGYTIALLGTSQIGGWLANYATIASVYGVTFITALCAGILVLALQKKYRWRCALTLIVIYLFGLLLGYIPWTHHHGKPIQVALLQANVVPIAKPNLNQVLKPTEAYWALTDLLLVHNHLANHLIVWPEGSVIYPFQTTPTIFRTLNNTAKKEHDQMIIGADSAVLGHSHNQYNAAILFGSHNAQYHKRHLFPIGETLPFAHFWHKLGWQRHGYYQAGQFKQPLFQVGHAYLAMFICSEAAYPSLLWPALPKANAIITIADDGWFNHSFEQAQHLNIARMRSIESGRYQAYSSNTGITAMIDNHGNIIQTVPHNSVQVLYGTLPLFTGNTPLIRLGLLFWVVFLGGFTGIILYAWRKLSPKNGPQ